MSTKQNPEKKEYKKVDNLVEYVHILNDDKRNDMMKMDAIITISQPLQG